jgi:drug/metabolite transporter (DMT)-like permease
VEKKTLIRGWKPWRPKEYINSVTRQYLGLGLGVIAVSFAAIFIRLAEAPPLVIASYRLGFATAALLPFALTRARRDFARLSRRELLLSLLAGSFLAVHFGLWISSLSYTSVVTSVVLVTINPVFVALLSRILFGETLSRQTVLGIAVCFIGAAVVGYANWRLGGEALMGGVLSLLGALAAAGYLLVGRRLKGVGFLGYISLAYGTAALLLVFTTMAAGYSFLGYSSKTFLMFALLAIVPQLLGHSALNWSLRFFSATLVTVAILGEPVGATVWSAVLLREPPKPLELVGGFLILTGIFLAFARLRRPGRAPDPLRH